MMNKKYFSEKQIYAATFFGGPIPPGILIYQNFKNIGDERKAILTIGITLISTVCLFYLIYELPEELINRIPNITFTILYTGIVYTIYHKYFGNNLKDNIAGKENIASNWTVAGITLLGLVISLAIIFTFSFLEPAFPGEKIEYGNQKHEIFFDKGKISESDIQTVGRVLTNFEYFNDDFRQAVRIDKTGNKCILNIPFDKDYWEDEEVLLEFDNLQSTLNIMTSEKFSLRLIHYELTGDVKTKDLY